MAYSDYLRTKTKSSSGSGASFGSFGATQSTSDIDTLIALAQARGGSVEEVINELTHPQTSILSTVADGFKKSFSNFIDIISTPSHIVAGAISPDYTISEAMKQNISPSDVLFGDPDPTATLSQKTGSFFTRLATDVILDPLSYVTFGASSATTFGTRALSRVTLAGGKIGTLNKAGQETLNYLRQVERQQSGLSSALAVGGETAFKTLPERLKTFKELRAVEEGGKIAPEVVSMSREEFRRLLQETVDAPLDKDTARKVLSNLIQKNPALAETLLDKGGLKFAGISILSGQRIEDVTRLIPGMTWLDKATEQTRLSLQSLFDPSIVGSKDAIGRVRFERLPPEYMDFQRQAYDMASYLKDKRIENLNNIIKANKLSKDEGSFLMSAVEAGKIPSDARLAKAYKQLVGYNENELKYLRERGIRISNLDNHAPHILVSSGVKVLPFKLPPSEIVGAAKQRKVEGTIFKADDQSLAQFEEAVLSKNSKLIEETKQNLKNDGFEIFDDNLLSAHVVRSLDNIRAGTMREFIESLARNFGIPAERASEGHVPLSLTRFKDPKAQQIIDGVNNSDLRFHPAIAKRVEEFIGGLYADEGTAQFLKSYDRIQNLWKASVTSIFPAFHGRNALSNVFLNFNDIGLEAMNPRTQGMTFQIFEHDFKANDLSRKILAGGEEGQKAADDFGELMTKEMFTDTSGYKWTFGELREVLKRNNIALRDDIVGQLDLEKSPDEMINALMPRSLKDSLNPLSKGSVTNPFSQNFKPFEWGRKVGNMVEGNARMVNFITNLRKTGDVGLAVARTKQFLFDYQYLTPFERHVMRRLIPFYSFMRKNLEVQVNTLLTAPGRTATQVKALTTLGDVMSGAQLSDEERKSLPDWMQDGISILTKREGSQVEILGSLGTPIEAVFQQAQPNQLLASISPIPRIPLELTSGYSFFHGKALSEVTNAAAFKDAPDIIRGFIKYEEVSFKNKDGETVSWGVSLRPERMHVLLNLPPTSRVLSAIKQISDADVSESNKLLQQLVGVRPFSFDLELEAAKREKELRQHIESILSDAGVGYEFRKFVPKDTSSSGDFGSF